MYNSRSVSSVNRCFILISIVDDIVWVGWEHLDQAIKKYGSTFYIGIAMVMLLNLYKLKFQFSLSYSIQLDFYHRQSEEHVEN